MKIYTRAGDGGETGLPGGRRLKKTDEVFKCLGDLDEANAGLGLAISQIDAENLKFPVQQLYELQSNLLSIGALIASDDPLRSPILKRLDKLTDKLESQIDDWDKRLPPLKNFILPGGSQSGASLHFCRTLIRRAERSYQALTDEKVKIIVVGRYLNRLSDYLFQAARFANHLANYREQIWQQ
ncbi:MAG: cob(I)yrinic acid a,c-diamide adenosyltransferase [Candidatus Berkelbacteria bacterium]|nr:MAG: cob(I)yrinic acid a,c-diamide adenosyltransferase [Candidatus Berkelbacteria bacterium]QQG51416.1 MAG: cob(I)yrinic acid a,c-diamide adenosyltransferase [Candidatus Berkelbacteria bacterium]